jgi:hypothetical protein
MAAGGQEEAGKQGMGPPPFTHSAAVLERSGGSRENVKRLAFSESPTYQRDYLFNGIYQLD